MEDKNIVPDLGKVIIGGEVFTGIGYQGLLTVNSKTYVDSPSRGNDGSMSNINDHDSFVVPRCKINFKYIKIDDYQRLCRVVSSSNEFEVTYYDKEHGKMVTHMMYCEPEEMKKLYNVGTYVIGVLDYEISFIGTLNKRKEYKVTWKASLTGGDSSTLSVASIKWGNSIKVLTTSDITALNVTIPEGKQLVAWRLGNNENPTPNGWKVYPNNQVSVYEDMVLWAVFADL
jgi:hypothetical protein